MYLKRTTSKVIQSARVSNLISKHRRWSSTSSVPHRLTSRNTTVSLYLRHCVLKCISSIIQCRPESVNSIGSPVTRPLQLSPDFITMQNFFSRCVGMWGRIGGPQIQRCTQRRLRTVRSACLSMAALYILCSLDITCSTSLRFSRAYTPESPNKELRCTHPFYLHS